MHGLHGFSDPTDNSHVKNLLQTSKRIGYKPSKKKDVISANMIKTLFDKYRNCNDLSVLRDLTMIVVAFSGFLRYDELSNICCKDICFENDSYVKIVITKSKTDQYRDGNEILLSKIDSVACPFNALKAYIKCAHIDLQSSHFLFKAVFKCRSGSGLRLKNKKLSYTRAKEVILAKLKEVAPPNLDLGLHSLRAGGATACANSNVNDRCWRRHGRWRSDAANGYVKDSISSRLTVSKNLGL